MHTKFIQIMVFYMLLIFLVFPMIAYYAFGKTLDAAGNGFVVGAVVSIILYVAFGRKMITNTSGGY